MERQLNARQQRFVEEYLIDRNATQAYIRAGYAKKGAEVSACKLLAIPKVKAAVEAGKAETTEKLGITKEWVLSRYVNIVKAEPDCFTSKDYMDALKVLAEYVNLFEDKNDDQEIHMLLKRVSRK